MDDDWTLLRRYQTTRSEQAFSALCERHVDMVYTSARRQLNDAHLADDVTQAVFIVLARKAPSLRQDRPLSAWLLKVTRYCAANARRANRSRQLHERKAAQMSSELQSSGGVDADLQSLRPLLDEGISRLRPKDRDAICLRFFEKRSIREVGAAMGISEEAAQKRVTRAVEKLREFFHRRGSSVTASTVAGILSAEALQTAPASLSSGLGSLLAAPTSAASSLAKGAVVTLSIQKAVATAAAIAILGLVIGGGVVAIGKLSGSTDPRIIVVAAPVSTTSSSQLATLTYSDGTVVGIIAITEKPAAAFGGLVERQPAEWWDANGNRIDPPDARTQTNISLGDDPGWRNMQLIVRTTGAQSPDRRFSVVIDGIRSGGATMEQAGDTQTVNYFASLSDSTQAADVRVGMPIGQYRDDAATLYASTQPTDEAPLPSIFGRLSEQNGQTRVEVFPRRPKPSDRSYRMVAYLRNGKTVDSSSYRMEANRNYCTFPCRPEEIERIVWRTRAYEWVTFKNVQLRPKP